MIGKLTVNLLNFSTFEFIELLRLELIELLWNNFSMTYPLGDQ